MRLLALIVLFVAACITPKAHENPKTTQELRLILEDFHMKMRWGLWEQAAAYTTDTYRNQFLGRYEELGDPVSTVEIEQEWYVEPDMTVQKKRYVESWVYIAGGWRIAERIPKDEWREREQGKTRSPDETEEVPPPKPEDEEKVP